MAARINLTPEGLAQLKGLGALLEHFADALDLHVNGEPISKADAGLAASGAAALIQGDHMTSIPYPPTNPADLEKAIRSKAVPADLAAKAVASPTVLPRIPTHPLPDDQAAPLIVNRLQSVFVGVGPMLAKEVR